MNDELPHTERPGNYANLDQMSVSDLLTNINREDQSVAMTIISAIPKIVPLVNAIADKLRDGGRLFYMGAGTSGRLGVVDASECPPTFGIPHGVVIGLIAGGDSAIREAVEFAEDDQDQGWKDLLENDVSSKDVVIGIAASGGTPYVIGALNKCNAEGITTGCITCNENTLLEAAADFPIVAVTGPEFVTGSTRMKAGTAQKLILNMISTAVMIKLGKVRGNRMVDMQLANNKLVDRGTRMIIEATQLDKAAAKKLLEIHGSVRLAIDAHLNK
ncbi:MAG: N-acetylmuramic acid 6-phosphate etherase [Flavobacteriales bacterium]|jgi:N-acetylmuramic acid 6-phosphate etherase